MDDLHGYREAFYSDYVSGHQGTVPEKLSEASLVADILPRLPSDHAAAILDVGCGQGQLLGMLHDRGYRHSTGIDTSPEQVRLAERLGRRNVRIGELFEVAASSPATYDAVVAIDVIEHFDRQSVQGVFQAFADLLRPGGRFVFRSPNGSSPFCGRMAYGDLTHGLVYTRRSLEQISHLTGFQHVAVFPVRPSGNTATRRLRLATWYVLEQLIKVPLIIETGQVKGHIVTQNLVGVAVKAS